MYWFNGDLRHGSNHTGLSLKYTIQKDHSVSYLCLLSSRALTYTQDWSEVKLTSQTVLKQRAIGAEQKYHSHALSVLSITSQLLRKEEPCQYNCCKQYSQTKWDTDPKFLVCVSSQLAWFCTCSLFSFPLINGSLTGMVFFFAIVRNGQGHIPEKDGCLSKHTILEER